MQLPVIRCSCGTKTPHTFFVQSKGEHAGRPLHTPIANCFSVQCNDEQDMRYWYALTWGLWTCKHFRNALRGSVVPFIRICDYQEILIRHGKAFEHRPQILFKSVEVMLQLEENELLLARKQLLMRELRVAIFSKILL